jgi:hypothetical protein
MKERRNGLLIAECLLGFFGARMLIRFVTYCVGILIFFLIFLLVHEIKKGILVFRLICDPSQITKKIN